ncbi:peptidoglycan bridge formation glycyltransferase FemA/FemB family protein [Marinomonas sp. CT5]|uniref:peptidoglycan bridge formation glycyltransferase FemA/FemB family protein n=1 Tax=Marinomonas sp. CT5 TaxID=2066133 RepID=UPI001BAED2C8|nr:peptidoglycan bridge formation glycyltransferase FemA/FemB family protein [Marinomonas sp. CT5]
MKPVFSFSSLLCKPDNISDLHKNWALDNERLLWFSRSSCSFLRVALWRYHSTGVKPRFWFPSYICSDALVPLKLFGCDIEFYEIGKELNYKGVSKQLKKAESGKDIIVYVHYFGASDAPGIADIAEFSKRNSLWLIEDAAHNYVKNGGIGLYGNFVLYSVYKRSPIPDGAALVIRDPDILKIGNREEVFYCDDPFLAGEQLRQDLIKLGERVELPSGFLKNTFWLVREIIRKTLGSISYKYQNQVLTEWPIRKNEAFFPNPSISTLSKFLLPRLTIKIAGNGLKHNYTSLAWDKLMEVVSYKHNLSIKRFKLESDYLAAYEIYDNCGVNKSMEVAEYLAAHHIPVLRWPNLPSDVLSSESSAFDRYSTLIMLPINSSIGINGIFTVTSKIDNSKKQLPELWCETVEEERSWRHQSLQVPLVQTYAYASARAKQSLDKLKVFSALGKQSNEVFLHAFYRQKKILFISVNIASFGPVLSERSEQFNIGLLELFGVTSGNWLKGMGLIVSPRFDSTSQNMYTMWKSGFRLISKNHWISSQLNLERSEDTLRGALNKKWRNQLVKAEKAGLRIEVSILPEDMLEIHLLSAEYLSSIGVDGVASELAENIAEEAGHRDSDVVLRTLKAYEGDEIVGGVVISEGCNEATYLFGWSSDKGRGYYVTQLLLWQGILAAKSSGIVCFDLGGIDRVGSPGVAKFKEGVNGREYTSVGTYIYVPRLIRLFWPF